MAQNPATDPFYLHGISEMGEWTATSVTDGGATDTYNADNVYTRTAWGTTAEDGARITASVTRQELRGGQSPALLDSFITGVGGSVELRSVTANLETLRRMLGLPTADLTGDLPGSKEVLLLTGSNLGSEEIALYIKTDGPVAPRYHYFPRAKVASFPELNFSRTNYFLPSASFDLYENAGGLLGWIEDTIA